MLHELRQTTHASCTPQRLLAPARISSSAVTTVAHSGKFLKTVDFTLSELSHSPPKVTTKSIPSFKCDDVISRARMSAHRESERVVGYRTYRCPLARILGRKSVPGFRHELTRADTGLVQHDTILRSLGIRRCCVAAPAAVGV